MHVLESFEDLYHITAGPDRVVSPLISGHLSIEYLLRKLAIQYDGNLKHLGERLSHARLIKLNRDIKTISGKQAIYLAKINRIRNKYSHEIGYRLDLQEIDSLFSSAIGVFSDYSNMFEECREMIRATGSIIDLDTGLISELFLAIVYDLHQALIKLGSQEAII